MRTLIPTLILTLICVTASSQSYGLQFERDALEVNSSEASFSWTEDIMVNPKQVVYCNEDVCTEVTPCSEMTLDELLGQHISFDVEEPVRLVSIYDKQGNRVFQKEGNVRSVNISPFDRGVYSFTLVTQSNKLSTGQIIVQ